MGQEINSGNLRLPKFLGLNQIRTTSSGQMEASALQNVNLTDDRLSQRLGSATISTNLFKEKTDNTAKPITGLYSGVLDGTRYQVGTGGDAFKSLTTSWTDRTGAVTVTDDADNLVSFATFFDNGGDECFIVCPEDDTPFKWLGGVADAAALAATPGDFKFPVVHMNRLWVVVDDIVYISDYFDCETWDVVWDLQRFRGDGEAITGIYKYADRIIVFKPSSIHMISGSSYADFASQTIVTGDGCSSGYSIQEIESRRYGNILCFLSKEGHLKGFNGSKNLIQLGDPVRPLYDKMNKTRLSKCGSAVFKKHKQYWLTMTYGAGTTHDQIVLYDYFNDSYTAEDGLPISSNLYHTGINANTMAIFATATADDILVTADYTGNILRQDIGTEDETTITVSSSWATAQLDMGDPTTVKLVTDLSVVTTQKSVTHLSVTVTSERTSGDGVAVIATGGSLWGTMVWGTGLWSAPDTKYSRLKLTPTDEGAIIGRYFKIQLAHSTADESMNIEDIILGVTNLGQQPEFVE
jgi:hypothetical protein